MNFKPKNQVTNPTNKIVSCALEHAYSTLCTDWITQNPSIFQKGFFYVPSVFSPVSYPVTTVVSTRGISVVAAGGTSVVATGGTSVVATGVSGVEVIEEGVAVGTKVPINS